MHQCPNVSWVNMGRISVNLLLVLEPEQVLLEPPESDSSSRKRETDLYISCHILSYLIISCHIFSYLNVTYRNISYHIVSYRVISCRILSCLIISYLIISDHIFISWYTQTGVKFEIGNIILICFWAEEDICFDARAQFQVPLDSHSVDSTWPVHSSMH